MSPVLRVLQSCDCVGPTGGGSILLANIQFLEVVGLRSFFFFLAVGSRCSQFTEIPCNFLPLRIPQHGHLFHNLFLVWKHPSILGVRCANRETIFLWYFSVLLSGVLVLLSESFFPFHERQPVFAPEFYQPAPYQQNTGNPTTSFHFVFFFPFNLFSQFLLKYFSQELSGPSMGFTQIYSILTKSHTYRSF